MDKHNLLIKAVSIMVLFSACNVCAQGEDPWVHKNATSTKDPLYIDMPDSIHQLEPVTVNILVNDPTIKAEANAVDLGYENFYTIGKQIQRSEDGTLRVFVPYSGEGSVTVGFKDAAIPTSPGGNPPSLTFTFYKVKKLPSGVDPRSKDPSSEYYGMECSRENAPYFCSEKEGCDLCFKSLGTVRKEYFIMGSTAAAKLPSGYDFVDNKKKEGNMNPGYLSYSYLKADKAISQLGSDGKPITCEDSYSFSLSAGYYSRYTDLSYEKDWQLSFNKLGIASGRTTVKDASGPGGLFPGKAIEVVTKEYISNQWDLFSIDYQLIAKMEPPESGTVQITMGRKGCAPKGEGKGQIDKAIAEVKPFGASYQVIYDGSGPGSFKPVHQYNVLKRETTSTITGMITDGHGDPMPYIKVTVELSGKTYDSRTDDTGSYSIPVPGLKPDETNPPAGKITVEFSYERDGKNYYTVRDHTIGDKIVSVWKAFSVERDSDMTQDMDVGTNKTPDIKTNVKSSNLRHLAPIYYHLSEVTDFALTQLSANIDYKLPVDVFVGGNDGTYYNRDDTYIHIDSKDAGYGSSNRPDNREYHEFCHHIMFSQWGGQGLRAPGDTNHNGYINQNTGDSFTEGFAEFCAMACSKYRGNPKPEIYAGFGSFEQNYKAWSMRGYYEEIAIAGILWDLYDDKNDRGDTISLPLDKMWDVLKVRRADFYEYYKAFKAAFPYKGNEIDKIFIEHGFFADQHAGNHQWDPQEPFKDLNGDGAYTAGEPYVDYGNVSGLAKPWMQYEEGYTIGKATNYERENRSSIVKLPNSYIKISDTGVSRYKIKVHYNDPADGVDYEYFSEVTDGKIYIASAPEELDATFTVEPDSKDYSAAKPYTLTNKEYLEKYYHTPVNQGFFDTHTFDLKPTGTKQDIDYQVFDISGKADESQASQEPVQKTESAGGSGINNTSLLLGGAGIFLILMGLGVFVILIVVFLVMKKKGKK